MSKTYVHKQKRGFFGWLFLLVFIGWNVLMVQLLFSYGGETANIIEASQSDAERTGAAIGTGVGVFFTLVLWCIGAVITGLLAILTRGGKTVVMRNA